MPTVSATGRYNRGNRRGLIFKLRARVSGLRMLGLISLAVLGLSSAAFAADRATDRAPLPRTPPPQAQDPDWQLCRATAVSLGGLHNMPPALMAAVSRAEAGRRTAKGTMQAWPWTINAQGRGYFFPSKQEAIWAVRRLMADGIRSIDVGCMQINLRFHPRAFTSLEEAFDPVSNITYAAHFLKRLRMTSRDWTSAIGKYHSYSPRFNKRYASRVTQIWRLEQAQLATDPPPAKASAKASTKALPAQLAAHERATGPSVRPLSSAVTLAAVRPPTLELTDHRNAYGRRDAPQAKEDPLSLLRRSTAHRELEALDQASR